jgi:hypothetical protein
MPKLLFIISLFIGISAGAQFGPLQIISTEVYGTSSVVTADLDGDGDIDILSESNVIAWYENINGFGLFGSEQIIHQNAFEYGFDASSADIDGDGDLDVISGTWHEYDIGKVSWYENIDGQGNFGDQIVIDQVPTPTTVIPADFDNDNDFDVLLVDRNNNKIAWYENLDGLGNFGTQNVISIALDWPTRAIVKDIDDDGDMDIVSIANEGDQVVWFINLNGQGSFSGLQIISNEVDKPSQVFSADIDGDGDLDVLSTSLNDNKIAWYENTDGNGSFGPQMLITTEIIFPRTLFVQDLDNDSDMDIISSFWDNGSGIIWLENLDGLGTFSSPILISDEVSYPTSVYATDLDQDQDFDVVSSSQLDHKIAWYENLTILSIDDIDHNLITISPNPVQDHLEINNSSTSEITNITIYDILGRLVLVENESFEQIDVSTLGTGLFLINIETEQGIIVKKVIKE